MGDAAVEAVPRQQTEVGAARRLDEQAKRVEDRWGSRMAFRVGQKRGFQYLGLGAGDPVAERQMKAVLVEHIGIAPADQQLFLPCRDAGSTAGDFCRVRRSAERVEFGDAIRGNGGDAIMSLDGQPSVETPERGKSQGERAALLSPGFSSPTR